MLAKILGAAVILLVLQTDWVACKSSPDTNNGRRLKRSFLSEFMAARKQIFPFTSDIERSKAAASSGGQYSPATSSQDSVRQYRENTLQNLDTSSSGQSSPAIFSQDTVRQVRESSDRENTLLRQTVRQGARKISGRVGAGSVNTFQYHRSPNSITHLQDYNERNLQLKENDGGATFFNNQLVANLSSSPSSIPADPVTPQDLLNGPIAVIQNGKILSRDQVLQLLQLPRQNLSSEIITSTKDPPLRRPQRPTTERPTRRPQPGLFDTLMASLRRLPVLGNVLRATVDPVYRPILNSILPSVENSEFLTSKRSPHAYIFLPVNKKIVLHT